MKANGRVTTGPHAAKLAYVRCAEQVLMDTQSALDLVDAERVTPGEMREFRAGLAITAARVRKYLRLT